MKNNLIYRESQSFITWWLCLLYLFVLGAGVYTAWSNSNEGKIEGFSVGALIGLIAFAIIFFMRLRSRIDQEGIHIRFFPFIWKEKTWGWDEIGDVYVKRYSPWEYGGWGYRFGREGTAFTTKGSYGIHLIVSKNGAKMLIGTQKPEKVNEILKRYRQVNQG
ncbi:hypothetical protein [Sphingobacterium haloxyli]|uniref:Bacterial Pleckstrin homology domain-containing protein n=1 Tax=Sphingobacterium haloxyli TaxID=2100533 RepID=A0A2S9J1X3_9SPHI|nr:hypothetical protein [Sphingobacterium haloxyli]PRD46734.1 hypothetical protein C5745_14110 [Sphingobacterium haloxyli]